MLHHSVNCVEFVGVVCSYSRSRRRHPNCSSLCLMSAVVVVCRYKITRETKRTTITSVSDRILCLFGPANRFNVVFICSVRFGLSERNQPRSADCNRRNYLSSIHQRKSGPFLRGGISLYLYVNVDPLDASYLVCLRERNVQSVKLKILTYV